MSDQRTIGYTIDDERLQRWCGQIATIVAKRVADLSCEFAGRTQNKRTHEPPPLPRCAREELQERQGKGRSLARAGLRRGPDIATSEHGGDRGGLNRRGFGVRTLGDRPEQRRRKAERGK